MMNKIIQGCCLEIMKTLKDCSVDLCIADPPYGISYQSARRIDKNDWKPKIENDETPFVDWIKPLYAKMKDGGRLVCFYRWDVQDLFLEEIIAAGFTVKSQIVWDKVSHGMGDLKGEFAPQHELMIYATKGRYEFKGNRPKTIYRHTRINGTDLIHPNQKPLSLMAAIIRDISSKDELIFDPFSGSGVVHNAAIQEGRNSISSELSEYYFNIGDTNAKNGVTLSMF